MSKKINQVLLHCKAIIPRQGSSDLGKSLYDRQTTQFSLAMNAAIWENRCTKDAIWQIVLLTVLLVTAVACQQERPQNAANSQTPQAFTPEPTATIPPENDNFIVIATDAPLPPFSDFDPFGNIIGFNNSVMESVAAAAGLDYEFVVTPNEGVLDSIAAGSARDFDAVMSALVIPEQPPEGIAFTDPYMEVGQVVVVLLDEREIQSAADLRPGMAVGVLVESDALEVAQNTLGLTEAELFSEYERPSQLVQALIDEALDAIIIESYMATYFVNAFPEQLRIAGEGEAAWISRKAYGIAVAADNTMLLGRLNEAIAQIKANQLLDRIAATWLIPEASPEQAVNPGEPRAGTAANEIFIGVVGQLTDMDPAGLIPDLISWEIKSNTMSGLYRVSPDSTLEPLLAESEPSISEDKLEYTITLRSGLQFPDGSDFTAEDVKWSVDRAARLGNFLVNGYLKDSDDNGFIDPDAVQVLDPTTVRFVLAQPTAYFPALLATPPYFPVSSDCYSEAADPGSACGGLGPYRILSWESGDRIRLQANPDWPGEPAPAFENILVRFYADAAAVRRSLVEFQSIDIAWTGMPYSDFSELSDLDIDGDGQSDFSAWSGPAAFKSYIIFEQANPPWDSENVRQAAALAIDRAALAATVFNGSRRPLFSPIPDEVPGHIAALPPRDLEQARVLLAAEGYNEDNPLAITLWYVNDGRYSSVEDTYATAIAAQLEETGVFQVELSGAAWETFRAQISECSYPAYLLGWPSPGQTVNYLDASSWTDFFVESTDSVFCSNYESEAMTELVTAATEEVDTAARQAILADLQALWAEELPTLDLTQEPRRAISLTMIENVAIDAMGLMHYELLTKEE